MKSYLLRLREKVGKRKLIHPAARILIENEEGKFLFLHKTDRDGLFVPAGALEEGETVEECIRREVWEETGLKLLVVETIGISTHPERETVTYPNGDVVQYFTVEFYSNKWEGVLRIHDKEEIQKVMFLEKKHFQELPTSEYSIVESLGFYQKTGKLMLK